MFTTTNNSTVMAAPVCQPLILRLGYCAILGIFCWLLVAAPSSARAEDRCKLTVETSGAVTFMEGGKRLGCFLPPEIDSPLLQDPDVTTTTLAASATSVRNSYTYRQKEAVATLEVSYSLEQQFKRVKVSTVVKKGPALQWWLSFEVEDSMDFPRTIAFVRNDRGSYPFQFALPGEGITAWWGIQDYGRLRWAFEMFAPAAAIETKGRRGMVFAAKDAESLGLRIHRHGVIEVTRRSPALLAESQKFSPQAVWYIGLLGKFDWRTLESDYLKQLNPGKDYLKGFVSKGTMTPE